MPKLAVPDWLTIEADYRLGELTIVNICKNHGISVSALMQARSRYGWPPRNKKTPKDCGPAGRKRLISRMFAVLEKQIERMENTMVEDVEDKEIALLGQLVRTLEKLVDLDSKQVKDAGETAPKTQSESREMLALRKKLSQRIGQFEKV
ncbi:hypothetical protein MNBD_ALPHA11-1460 [hydrothermal vent metagenome]|uniref:Uncharacterized protein n=1 Tax=hydrothermal vent metagenome TaxID=652676 RepID=A0A3B0U6F4_9ZZZZ